MNTSFALSLIELEQALSGVMLKDRFRLQQRVDRLRRASRGVAETDTAAISAALTTDNNTTSQRQELAQLIAESKAIREQRALRLPPIKLDSELPIFARQEEIAHALQTHQVVVISGATGSGKSTQLPIIALQAGLGIGGLIGHTQPRRIAARSVANRIAQQIGTPLGGDVGFKIRFSDQTSEQTYIKVMTDGILLAEIQRDRYFEQYELIIVDEAHERSLNIDYLLGYLKNTLVKRPDLKLIITSATIDTNRFVEHFSTAAAPVPVIDVEGRTYPVDIQYRPLEVDEPTEHNAIDWEDHLISTIREVASTDPGDMLVFLPTEHDIRAVHKKLKSVALPGVATEVLPLYARLSIAQQNEIFVPGKRRRIVLATNVAESSITVPRIRFVVDSGTARISHYSPRSKVQRLPIQPISQASADQRAGRCGRIGPGICVRLYSETDFISRPKFTTPEIRRTNLAAVILQTLALRLGSVDDFPFLDPPRSDAVRDGYKTLFELGAIDHHRRLTTMGKQLARLPVDPRIGRMLFAAEGENALAEVLIIAAGLELQDPRVRPQEKQAAADQAHEKFRVEDSDFLTLLKVWDFFHQLKEDLSRSKLKIACERNFLSYPLMLQWQEIHRQLANMIGELGLKPRKRQNQSAAIHKSLLAGLLSGIAMVGDRFEYTGAGGLTFMLWPGSSLFKSKPRWIVAAEIVETSRRYARMVAKIDPDWIEPLAQHLVNVRYSDPYWSSKKQSVQALEHVSLWGLPIVNGRHVNYGRIDPETARSIFIQEALANEGLQADPNFFLQNRQLIEDINREMTKTRRRDLIVDSYQLEAFYQRRLPENVYDKVSLLQLLKKDNSLNQQLLMTREKLFGEQNSASNLQLFPDQAKIGSMEIPLSYRFAPGEADDGATIRLPLAGIGQLDDIQAGWLVPGLVESRIVSLIRGLPKSVRRNLVPAPETAARVAQELEFAVGNFYEVVARRLSELGGEPIQVSDFDLTKLDAHLKINIQILDDEGNLVAQGRSVSEIREQLGAETSGVTNIVEVDHSLWQQDGLVDWTWGELPERVTVTRGRTQLDAFPALVDQHTSVGLRLTDSPQAAHEQTVAGLIRLFQILNRKSLKSQTSWLPDLDRHVLPLARYAPVGEIKSQLGDLMVRIAFLERSPLPRAREAFEKLQFNAVERISMATQEVAKWLPKLSRQLHQTGLRWNELPKSFGKLREDISVQLSSLFASGFLQHTPWMSLTHYPRYLEAICYRLERVSGANLTKDQAAMEVVAKHWRAYQEIVSHQHKHAIVDPELTVYRWMIEELRVSLFAQPLGTSIKVSDKRLEEQQKGLKRF